MHRFQSHARIPRLEKRNLSSQKQESNLNENQKPLILRGAKEVGDVGLI